ncbi:MAG: DUF971 domain-containing protein [Bryobacterales bacterium]
MPKPAKINRHQAHDIEIVWDTGRVTHYPARFLRLECPCASCKDEMTGKRLITDSLLPVLTFPTKIEPVGRYAIQIHWSDNHSTGIYTVELLWKLADALDERKKATVH